MPLTTTKLISLNFSANSTNPLMLLWTHRSSVSWFKRSTLQFKHTRFTLCLLNSTQIELAVLLLANSARILENTLKHAVKFMIPMHSKKADKTQNKPSKSSSTPSATIESIYRNSLRSMTHKEMQISICMSSARCWREWNQIWPIKTLILRSINLTQINRGLSPSMNSQEHSFQLCNSNK